MNSKPWENEPDEIVWWTDGLTPCYMLRGPFGSWLGYVGVSGAHPAHKLHYDDLNTMNVEVHGGLTYSDDGVKDWDGAPYWWFGFDCAHHMDLIPELHSSGMSETYGVYRDMFYVQGQCNALARQLELMVA